MLYATTRSDRDIYTAQRTLNEDQAPDGGLYVPFREPRFSENQIREMGEKSFQQNMADLLNLLFKTKLTPWDLEFAIGRRPFRLQKVGRRTMAGERWHNTGKEFSCTVKNLADRIRAEGELPQAPGIWMDIAAGIASLFSLYAMLEKETGDDSLPRIDVAVDAGELSGVVSAWYARSWGLPIGKIICGCPEGSLIWDLVHGGQMDTGEALEQNSLPRAMESLIYLCGGRREVQRFMEAGCLGSVYQPSENALWHLRQGICVSVISDRRVLQTIRDVRSAHSYIMHPRTVLPYAGLLDYRSVSADSGWGLILADESPEREIGVVAKALGMEPGALRQRLNQI